MYTDKPIHTCSLLCPWIAVDYWTATHTYTTASYDNLLGGFICVRMMFDILYRISKQKKMQKKRKKHIENTKLYTLKHTHTVEKFLHMSRKQTKNKT